jgi:hypothetical protein
MDPIETGMTLHVPLMERLSLYVKDPEELRKIGRMIDILVGSAQVTAVESGLSGTVEQYRSAISEKLGLYLLEG